MTNYHAYLIRVWRDEETAPWRTTVILPHSGAQHAFATLEEAWAFLMACVFAQDSDAPDGAGHQTTEK